MVKRHTILLMVLLGFNPFAHGEVTARLSNQFIDELETVRLIIRSTGTRQSQPLDLSALEQDFAIINNNTSSQYRYINGQEQSWVDYQITLQPKRTGELSIPPIRVGRDLTPSLILSVKPLAEQTRKEIDKLVFFEQEVSARSIYVQSQVVMTRRLLYSNGVQLYSDLPDAPQLPDAVVMKLGEPRSTTTQRNGKRYGVVEQRYAIFPEGSGTFTIPAINVTASVRLIENGRSVRRGVRIGTQPETVTVKPIPPGYPEDQPWLPAEHVQLHQVVSPKQSDYQVGDTLTHELLIYIQGNLGSIAPPLNLPVNEDDFRIYPQNPVINDDTSGQGVAGSRLQTTSLVPTQAGQLTIPATRITWWNTRTDQLQVARVEPASLTVQGEGIPTGQTQNEPAATAAETETAPQGPARTTWPSALIQIVPWALAIFIVLLAARTIRHRARAKPASPRRLKKALALSIDQGEPKAVQNSLARWLANQYRQSPTQALSTFRAGSPEAAHCLDHLARLQFSKTPGAKIDPQVAQYLKAVLSLPARASAGKTPGLPPLYSHESTKTSAFLAEH